MRPLSKLLSWISIATFVWAQASGVTNWFQTLGKQQPKAMVMETTTSSSLEEWVVHHRRHTLHAVRAGTTGSSELTREAELLRHHVATLEGWANELDATPESGHRALQAAQVDWVALTLGSAQRLALSCISIFCLSPAPPYLFILAPAPQDTSESSLSPPTSG